MLYALHPSLESSGGVAVSLEGTVDNVGSHVHEVWHDWLVLRSIPRNVSWLSNSVSVARLVVLMEDWSLSGSPLEMGILDWWVSWEHSAEVEPEEVWVVLQSSQVVLMTVGDEWSLVSQTSTKSLGHKEYNVEVGDPASDVEVLDWKLSDNQKAKEASNLGSRGVGGIVPVGLGDWSNDDVLVVTLLEPGAEDVEILLSLISPGWKPLLGLMRRKTETDEIMILNVVSHLIVQHSSLSIIMGVLKGKD